MSPVSSYLSESLRVGQEMLTLSGTPDLTPHGEFMISSIHCIYVADPGCVDGQLINNQGYQSHQGCQSYLARDTRGKGLCVRINDSGLY